MMIASVAKSVAVSTNKRKKPLKVAHSPPATLKHCDKCDFHSDDMNEFSEHMKFEHNMDEIYPCDLCSFYTKSLWDYQVHMEKTHRDQQMHESDNSEEIVDEQLVEPERQEKEEEEEEGEEEEEEEDEEGDENKNSILYSSSSSSSSSSSICIDPTKINTEQELNRNSLLNNSINNSATKNQVINNDNKMLFDLANQYSSPNQLSQLIQKYNQHLSCQASMCSPLPRLSLAQQIQNVAPSHEKTKRHYNSEVDPARYRKVLEDGITKFACSICGNTYKWRKSLNKHWKEKHITETPPPLDAPVAVKLRNAAAQPPATPLTTSNSSQCLKKEPTQLNNALNLFHHYLSSMTNKTEEMDALAPLDLSMKPKRERSGSPTASHRSNSASSSTSSSSNTSSSATSSDSSDTANHQPCTPSKQPPPLAPPPPQHQQHQQQQSPVPSGQLSAASSPQVYNQKLFICSVCDAKFHVVDQINEHFLKNHYNEYQRELSSKSPPRNTNVAQQNEEWNLSDPHNPLKCIKCDFVGRWPTELQKHAASHSTSRPFKCLICSLTYKWRWDLAKHFDRTHPTFRNPYKKRDRDAARSTLINPMQSNAQGGQARKSRSRSRSNESDEHKKLNKYEQICINPNTPPLSSSSSSSSSTCSIQPPPPPPPPFLPPFMSPQSQNTAAMYAAYLLANPALLTNPLFAMAALQNTVPTGPAPPSVEPRKKSDDQAAEPRVKSSASGSSLSKRIKLEEAASTPDEKESRNFQCFWCDFRGRWRSEIIQHMRCHHAREKPYRCSSCMYASNWKWDVQKHTKKQHPNATAKIVEIPDQVLFPDLKDLNFFDSIKPLGSESPCKKSSAVHLTPPSSSSSSSSTSSISSVASVRPPPLKNSALNCHQCPYVACNLSDLRRHLIVHSNEQPYHCCSCPFKSKWKSDVKKHQRSAAHIGPILVGKKAMQKVIETLGLDKRSELPAAIDVIDNRQCKSNEKLVDEDEMAGKRKRSAADDSDEELYEQLNDDEEYFDDDEEPQQTLDNFEQQQFAHDESAELEIDQHDDQYHDDVDDEY